MTIPSLELGIIKEIIENTNETTEDSTEAEQTNETVEVSEIPEKSEYAFYGKANNGTFSVTLNLPKDMPTGEYKIDIIVYEKNSAGAKISEGVAMANLKIPQILTNADIAINNQNFNPGDTLNFQPLLTDQAGSSVIDKVSVIIRDINLNRVFERIVDSGVSIEYPIPANLTSGFYEIEISKDGIKAIKKFFVNEKAIVSFELENETVIVTNIGNIPYNKDIQIDLNGKPFIKNVNLELGGQEKFKLTGEGETDVKVTDGEKEISGTVALVGYSINVRAVGEEAPLVLKTPILWIIVIVFLGAGLLFSFRHVLKQKSFTYPIKDKLMPVKKLKVVDLSPRTEDIELPDTKPDNRMTSIVPRANQKYQSTRRLIQKTSEQNPRISFNHNPKNIQKKMPEKREVIRTEQKQEIKKTFSPAVFSVTPTQAEQVLVLNGQKTNATVIALKIKNKISNVAKQSLERAIESAYGKRGVVYEQGDYLFIIFSTLITRAPKNEIRLMLIDHNKRFKDKIKFGIGINSGDLINKIEDRKLKFTALGSFMITAKKLAEFSDEQVLLTKESYEKGMVEIKASKIDFNGLTVYEAKSIVDHEKNQKFINEFLKRTNSGR